MTVRSDFKELMPGAILFESEGIEADYNTLISAKKYIDENEKLRDETKNVLWDAFHKQNNLDYIKQIQSNILSCLALYCDIYDEAIHSLQWQESIDIMISNPGEPAAVFNPSRSRMLGENEIDPVPFSRQICVEYFVNDDYDGGAYSWKFFDVKNFKPKSGNILVYPGFFLYTKESKPVIRNKKVVLFTSFNGGKDYVSENRAIDLGHNELMFSYMR